MRKLSGLVGFLTALMFVAATVAMAEERDPLPARVPKDQIAEAKALKNPVAVTPENIAKGKALFEGKGTCFNCHGKEGKGDGPAGQILNPSPRNFTNCNFHKKRKDGLVGHDRHCAAAGQPFRGGAAGLRRASQPDEEDRKSTRLNSSHQLISYAAFCL